MPSAEVKNNLLELLKAQNSFWSYDLSQISDVSDEVLIEKTLVYLDLPQIDQLISAYGKEKVKRVFRDRLIPQGEYLYTLNRFLAWYYFGVKRPDTYLHQLATRHMNKMFA